MTDACGFEPRGHPGGDVGRGQAPIGDEQRVAHAGGGEHVGQLIEGVALPGSVVGDLEDLAAELGIDARLGLSAAGEEGGMLRP
ncbi:hypothetical protein CJ026_026270 [Ralstonia pickettii]|nr:hypothetical protein CJ026_026270 [Ralstonia pickettii]